MPVSARKTVDSGIRHVMIRGNNRRIIFGKDEDYEKRGRSSRLPGKMRFCAVRLQRTEAGSLFEHCPLKCGNKACRGDGNGAGTARKTADSGIRHVLINTGGRFSVFSSFAPLSGHFSVSGFPSPGTDRRKLPFVDEQAVRRSGVQG